MARLFQKIEAAVEAVGAAHQLKLKPATSPAYPAHVDAVDPNRLRMILNQRTLPRTPDLPDLTQEVLTYLDEHPDLEVPGLPPAPPNTPPPTVPPPPPPEIRVAPNQ